MSRFETGFGRRMARRTGALELMEDLGDALAAAHGTPMHMLGGGNPARIPGGRGRLPAAARRDRRRCRAVRPVRGELFRRRPATCISAGRSRQRRCGREYGWPLDRAQRGADRRQPDRLLFPLQPVSPDRVGGTRAAALLLPLAPEYIGYADLGLADGMLLAQPATIEELPGGFFKYHVDFEHLAVPADVGAICVSRPTNPSGNVLTHRRNSSGSTRWRARAASR